MDPDKKKSKCMFWFQKGHNKTLNAILIKLEQNMANNYKDNAQEDFREFCRLFDEMETQGGLKGKQLDYYKKKRQEYEESLKSFTHKDQKPYWT